MNNFRLEVQAQRPYLLRFASLQLRDGHAAEDAVQETLVAALAAEGSFAGRSNLRTWLTGILKHKIIDAIRRAGSQTAREVAVGSDEDFDALFDETGHWAEMPVWKNPDASLEQAEFLRTLEECLEHLPAKTAQAFMLREHLGFETDEICKELAITPTHFWVLLYRARMALRKCLDTHWFAK